MPQTQTTTAHHFDLAHTLPEYQQAIHDLKTTDTHFRKLFDAYNDVAKSLHRFEMGQDHLNDIALHDLKKQRLHLLEQITGMLKLCTNDKTGCCGQCHKATA